MTILLIVSMVPQADGVGAIPKLLHAQLSGLRERGHEVTVVGSFGELPGQAETADALMRSEIDAHFVDRRRSPSTLRRWRVRAELASTWIAHRWPWRAVCAVSGVQPVIDQLTAARDFDVIVLEESLMTALRLPPATPKVLTEHEAVHAPATSWRAARFTERPERALRVRDWRRWVGFQRMAWEHASLVQVYSRGDAAAIERLSPWISQRVRINPYGLSPPSPADPTRAEAGMVLFAGTFSHLPNRDAALWLAGEILPAVRAHCPGARMRLVGNAPPREVLDLAGPGVEVIADVDSMRPQLEAAEVVVAPVRNGGGMRMKVLEAMAMGKAVVTTSLGAEGFTEFERDLPFLVGNDTAEISSAIVDMLTDEPRRRAMGERARAFALRHHSPSAWAARLEGVYEEAHQSAGGG